MMCARTYEVQDLADEVVMADSRKPVQRAVAPEAPAPVAAPRHEWELARMRAPEEITLRWAPLIGAVSAQLMHILIDRVW
jgi:hypothetical protein